MLHKDCFGKFIEKTEDELKWVYATSPKQTMTAYCSVKTKLQKSVTYVLNSLKTLRMESKRSLPLRRFILRSSPQRLQSKIPNTRHILTVFRNLLDYYIHQFINIRALGKLLNFDDNGVNKKIKNKKEISISFNFRISI